MEKPNWVEDKTPYSLVWLTDTHFNFVDDDTVKGLCKKILDSCPDGVVFTGDISDGRNLNYHLNLLLSELPYTPLYIALGNHDYYHSSLGKIRKMITEMSAKHEHLHWLPMEAPIRLTEEACLIGHDGWYDGRNGDFWNSNVVLSDFHVISELRFLPQQLLCEKIAELGDEAADSLQEKLKKTVLLGYKTVYLATHVSPFEDSSTYRGQKSDEHWQPFFSCQAVGDMLTDHCMAHPDQAVRVICGHSHGEAFYEAAHNLFCWAGGARYEYPRIQKVLIID